MVYMGVALRIGLKCCTICIYGRILTTDKDREFDGETVVYYKTIREFILKES